MNSKFFVQTIFVLFSGTILIFPVEAQTSFADLEPLHSRVLNAWLKTKKGWRLALEKDYGAENLKFFREQTNAKLKPFYAARDFNGDRREDFAVILIKGARYAVAVFNAPFSKSKPAFYTDKIEAGDIVYFNPNLRRLLVGPYASDAGFQLIPKGKFYKVGFLL